VGTRRSPRCSLLGLAEPPWIAAHRGASSDAPENTLEALHLAVEQGADFVEIDLQLTADGALVLCHDRDLSRIAGIDRVIERETRARLLSVWPALADLPQALSALPPTFPLNLELKRHEASRLAIGEALMRDLRGRRRPVLISSFDHRLLDTVRSLLPGAELAPIARQDAASLLLAGESLAAASLHAHRRLAAAELVDAAAFAGRPLLAYTVDDPAEARRLFAAGVAGLFTNRPAALRRALEETR
jgi:glycerophosphoryl diester phosphodiesterase